MAQIVEIFKYIKSDPDANNNKFWEVTYYSDDGWIVRNGRVDSAGQTHEKKYGRRAMETKIRSKERDGYVRVKVMDDIIVAESNNNTEKLKEIALSQISNGQKIIEDLVQYFTEVNAHQISVSSGGNIQVDMSTGLVRTPLGILTKEAIDDGRKVLHKIKDYFASKKKDEEVFKNLIKDYCNIIPSKVSSRAGWHLTFIQNEEQVGEQLDFLNQMEATIDMALDRIEQAKKMKDGNEEIPRIFDATMKLCEDKDVIKAITQFYQDNIKKTHASSNLKIKSVYEVSYPEMQKAFEKKSQKIGNVMRLWHGTRSYNILSILRKGLIIPDENAFNVCGRAFGNGVYFSDQSTKSLNYSAGYWDSNSTVQNRTFMFLADVAMGKMYRPGRHDSRQPQKGFDSTFAEGGVASVQNNEMIVFSLDQINMRYLVEFG